MKTEIEDAIAKCHADMQRIAAKKSRSEGDYVVYFSLMYELSSLERRKEQSSSTKENTP
jgi:uncharacterized protein involved in high-affinity Fe2+ transport